LTNLFLLMFGAIAATLASALFGPASRQPGDRRRRRVPGQSLADRARQGHTAVHAPHGAIAVRAIEFHTGPALRRPLAFIHRARGATVSRALPR